MSNNNGFLSNYNKGSGDFGEPASEVVVRDADLGYKYEEKSGFKKPEFRGGSGLPPFRRPKLLIPIIAGAAAVVGVVILLVILLNGGVAVIDFTGKPLSDAQLWANQNGVMLSTDEQFNNEYDAGTVFDQDKKKGETVKKGEFLSLKVSKGHDMSVTLKVPDLASMTSDQIQAWADENFMNKVRITTEFSDTVPSGKVIRFTINDNTVVSEIRRDTPVYVIVSKGPQDQSSIQVTVPDFKTMSVSEAQLFANDNGITLDITEQYDAYVPKGSVISQSVKAQEKVSKGSVIKLVYSLGKLVEIPDFSDYTKEQASAVASGLGIPVTITEKYSGSKEGRFLSQSLTAGSVYGDNDFLVLTYSLGNQVAVTSYVGQTKDAIWNWANELNTKGAKINIDDSTKIYDDSSPKGTILSQNPVNEIISYSSTIYITVSLGSQTSVPDFVDHTSPTNRGYDTANTREEAVEKCTEAGLIPKFVTAKESNPNYLPGEVIDQNPSAGTKTPEWSVITITLNPAKSIKMRDFVNPTDHAKFTEINVKAEYNATYTLIFVVNANYDTTYGHGEVVGQSIKAGTTVSMGAVLTLYLNP